MFITSAVLKSTTVNMWLHTWPWECLVYTVGVKAPSAGVVGLQVGVGEHGVLLPHRAEAFDGVHKLLIFHELEGGVEQNVLKVLTV